jgi:hypothetical protein
LKLGPAAILNQNPIFEMDSKYNCWFSHKPVGGVSVNEVKK